MGPFRCARGAAVEPPLFLETAACGSCRPARAVAGCRFLRLDRTFPFPYSGALGNLETFPILLATF